MDLKMLLFQVVYCLGMGIFFSLSLVKHHLVGKNYFLYRGILVFLLCGGVKFFLPQYGGGSSWIFVAGVLLYTVSFLTPYSVHHFLVYPLIAVGIIPLFSENIFLSFNAFFAMLLLGLSMATMLLGHWYLVQPKLPIDELKRVFAVLFVLIFIRFLWGSFSLGKILVGKSELELYRYFLAAPGIFLLMRYLWGLFAPFLLSFFIWQTIKIRSTQSATGMLYVLTIFILTGEILSLYLALSFGMYW